MQNNLLGKCLPSDCDKLNAKNNSHFRIKKKNHKTEIYVVTVNSSLLSERKK